VLPGLFVGLLRAYPDEFLEDIAHLDVVHPGRSEVYGSKPFDDQIQQVLLGHSGNLRAEIKPLHDRADVGRKAVDIAVEIRRELIGVVQQARKVELGEVVERVVRNLRELVANDVLWLRLQRSMLFQHHRLGGSKNAIKSTQDREWQDDLAVLVALVWATEQVADAPNKAGDLGVCFGRHFVLVQNPFFCNLLKLLSDQEFTVIDLEKYDCTRMQRDGGSG
jgi:hypothetical protein